MDEVKLEKMLNDTFEWFHRNWSYLMKKLIQQRRSERFLQKKY